MPAELATEPDADDADADEPPREDSISDVTALLEYSREHIRGLETPQEKVIS